MIAYKMRDKAYLACGAIAPCQGESFRDPYDDRPHCETYLLVDRGNPIASIRTCIYAEELGRQPIPAFEVYRDPVQAHIGLDRTIVESNGLVSSILLD